MTNVKMNCLIFLMIVFLSCFIFSFQSYVIGQINFEYGSKMNVTTFFNLNDHSQIQLPQEGRITIFYFPFIQSNGSNEDDYLSSIENCFSPELISIYNVVLDTSNIVNNSLSKTVYPNNSEIFQFFWEMNLINQNNYILIVDKLRKIKYKGIFGSLNKFILILKNLNIDFSLSTSKNLYDIINNKKNTFININNKKNINNTIKNDKSKLLIFYCSLCFPCGEHILITELHELCSINKKLNFDIYFIFRKLNKEKKLHLIQLSDELNVNFTNIYDAKNTSPMLERFFLKGNPFLAYFSNTGELLKTRIGNTLTKPALEQFLMSLETK